MLGVLISEKLGVLVSEKLGVLMTDDKNMSLKSNINLYLNLWKKRKFSCIRTCPYERINTVQVIIITTFGQRWGFLTLK